MQEDLKQRLDKAFAENAEKKKKAEERRAKVVSAEEQFLLDFAQAAESVIRPALIEIGELGAANGLPYRIESSKGGRTSDGREERASIGIIFLEGDPTRYRPSHEYAGWTAFAERHKQNVWFHKRTMGPGRGGMACSTGESTIANLSPELIQSEVAAVLTEILSN